STFMSYLEEVYKSPLALHTDLYQLTMAYAYWKSGMADTESVFHLHFRSLPFKGGFAVACGLDTAIEYIEKFRFTREDTDYLSTINGNNGEPLFEREFLEYLLGLKFDCDVDAMPEGTPVFANEP